MIDQKKHDYFKQIAGKRVERILEDLDAFGNCSSPVTYDYSNQELLPIFAAITEKLAEVRQRLVTHSPHRGIPFRLNPPDSVELDGHRFSRRRLCTAAEATELLNESGPHLTALEPIWNHNRAACGDELCWSVTIPGDTSIDYVLLAVQEGLLYLPYDKLDQQTCEQFYMRNIKLLDREQAQTLLTGLRNTYTRLHGVLSDAMAFGLVHTDSNDSK